MSSNGTGRLVDLALILLLFSSTFTVQLLVHFRNPLPYGVDGPFYVYESKCILSTLKPCIPDSPLALYIIAALSSVLGYYLGVKVFLATITSLITIPLYFTLKKITLKKGLSTIIVLATYTFNPFTLRLSLEFAKNILGLLFLALMLYYLYDLVVEETSRFRIAILLLLVVLVAFTHILVFAVMYFALLVVLVYAIISKSKVLNSAIALFVIANAMLVLGLFTPFLGWEPYMESLGLRSGGIGISNYTVSKLTRLEYPSINIEFLVLLLVLVLQVYFFAMSSTARPYTLFLIVHTITSLLPLPSIAGLHWRTMLLNSIIIPITLALAYRTMGKTILVLLAIIVLALTPSYMRIALLEAKPSLPQQVLLELEQALNTTSSNCTYYYVPDKLLLHWIRVYVNPLKAYGNLNKISGRLNGNYTVCMIVYTVNPLIEPPRPSIASKLLYRGNYIYVYATSIKGY